MLRIWNDKESAVKIRDLNASSSSTTGSEGAADDVIAKTIQSAIYLFMPFQLIGTVLAIAQFQLAGLMSIVFGYLAILYGSIVALDVATALCITTLPLIYFRSFEQLWSQILTVLAGLAIIPCLYYIFSALGFIFIDQLFDSLFPIPEQGSTASFAIVLNSVFTAAIIQTFAVVDGYLTSVLEIGAEALASLLSVFVFLGKLMFGSLILTTMIGSGVAFGAAAPGLALRWRQGFASEDLFSKITESLMGLQSTMGSGLGSVYSDALGSLSRGAGGLTKGLGRK